MEWRGRERERRESYAGGFDLCRVLGGGLAGGVDAAFAVCGGSGRRWIEEIKVGEEVHFLGG